MNTSHLKHRLNELSQMGMGNTDPMPVLIATNDPALGSRRMLQISSVDLGIDWEHGKVIITAEERVYTRSEEEEIKRLTKALDQAMFENMRLKRQLGEK